MSIEAYESLLEHPGWRLFDEHVKQEWGFSGTKYLAELDKALNLIDDSAAVGQARQIRSARKAIEQLMSWPVEELARLKRQEPAGGASMSRRGGL